MTQQKADALLACFFSLALLCAMAATVDPALMRAAFVVFLAFVVVVAGWLAPIFFGRLRQDWRVRRDTARRLERLP